MGADEDQPDTCHILIDRRVTQWGLVLVAKQLKPFAAMTKEGENAISRAAQDNNLLCLIVDYENTDRVIGAAGDKSAVEQFKKETDGKPFLLGGAGEYVKHLTKQISEGRWPVM